MAPPARAGELLVFAAVSTTEALRDVGRAFTEETGYRVTFAFGSSGDLARQVLAGAPADVFLSADAARMDAVERGGGLLPGSRVDLLSNRLVVVVVPVGAKRELTDAAGLRDVKRLALADPAAVPAGVYARAWLTRLGLWTELAPRVVPASNVRGALAAVEAGRVDAGVVYATDAAHSQRVRVAFAVPEGEGPRIVYPVAAMSRSKAPEAARAFVRFLQGDAARRAFEQRGFIVLAGKPAR